MFKRPERPLKFNAGMGIGKALELGGNYYNELAIQKLNQQALEESRAYQTEERLAGQTFQREMQDDRQQFSTDAAALLREQQVSDLEAANIREDEYRADLRDQELADQATQRRHDLDLYELGREERSAESTVIWGSLSTEDQLDYANRAGISTEDLAAMDPERPFTVQLDSMGNPVGQVSPDPEFIKTADGWERTTRGSTSQSLAESEAAMTVRLSAFDAAMDEMVSLFGEGYQTRGGGAVWNDIASNVWGGNWIVSGDAQQFRAARLAATEAIFKAFSGAAGSDAEAERYASMLPSYGDTQPTIRMKLRMLSNIRDAMQRVTSLPSSAFNPNWTPSEDAAVIRADSANAGVNISSEELQRRQQLLSELNEIARANNFDVDTETFIDPVTGQPNVFLSPNAGRYIDGTFVGNPNDPNDARREVYGVSGNTSNDLMNAYNIKIRN